MSGEEGDGANQPRRKRSNKEITSDISEDDISDVNDGAWEVDGSVFPREFATLHTEECTYQFFLLFVHTLLSFPFHLIQFCSMLFSGRKWKKMILRTRARRKSITSG